MGAALQPTVLNRAHIAIALFVVSSLLTVPVYAQNILSDHQIVIGTDGQSDTSYGLAAEICTIFDRSKDQHGYSCALHVNDSSVETLENLRTGAVNFAMVPSDVLYYAVQGFGPFKAVGANPDLRTVVSMQTESLTILARADAHIATFDDLRDKRVNIGPLGSGQRSLFDVLMLAKGGRYASFGAVLEIPVHDQAQALCDGTVDAVVYAVGHPNVVLGKAASMCAMNVVEISGPSVATLLETYPYFVRTVIPGGKYSGTPTSVHSFGVAAMLVSTTNTPEDMVFQMTKILFNNVFDLKFSHASMSAITPLSMSHKTTIGVHRGTVRFIENSTDLYK